MQITLNTNGTTTLVLTSKEVHDLKVLAEIPQAAIEDLIDRSTHPWIGPHTQTWSVYRLLHELFHNLPCREAHNQPAQRPAPRIRFDAAPEDDMAVDRVEDE